MKEVLKKSLEVLSKHLENMTEEEKDEMIESALTLNKKKMNLTAAISKITKQLKTDKEYRRSWSANIAMAYIDNEHWYKQKTGKKHLNRNDKHTIANNAAEYFLKLLCNDN